MPNDFSGTADELDREVVVAPGEDAVVAGTPVVVRRHAGVAALIGAAASAVAIAYLWRASTTMAALDWTLMGVMAVIAAYYLAALVDARTPLLVADDLGVRVRLGHEWRGLPWDAIGEVVVHPRQGLLRDGRLVLAPRSLARALDGLDTKARRHVALNQKLYGAPLAVPVGTTTRVSLREGHTVAEALGALTLGRADVVEVDPKTREEVDTAAAATAQPAQPADTAQPAQPADTAHTAKPADRETRPAADRSPTDRVVEGAPTVPDPREAPAEQGLPRVAPADDLSPRTGSAAWTIVPALPTPGESVSRTGDTNAPDRDTEDPFRDTEAPVRDTGDPFRDTGDEPAARAPRRSILGGIGTVVSRVAKGRSHDVDGDGPHPAPAAEGPAVPATTDVPATLAPAAALRETRPGLRAEATLDLPVSGSTALDPAHDESRTPLPEGRELRRPGSVDLVFEPVQVDDRVRPISTLGEPVAPLVIDDYVTEPAYDPVIGPELAAARTRLGLSVDNLADRTRIRPHVIESIEVDDFAPCGGDFYARGHLRTLARILGKDPEPLLASFEERYATAPINARRVFEAELATGMTGSMRSTVGGPNWGMLVGVVLVLVLVWGVVRLFDTAPGEMVEMPAPVLNGPAAVVDSYPLVPPAPAAPAAGAADPVSVRLTAAQADTDVEVRDGAGALVFSGELVLGERKTLTVTPPVRIRAADGGAVEVRVDDRDRGFLGELGEPARRIFR